MSIKKYGGLNHMELYNFFDPTYVLEPPAKCPNCRRDILEKTVLTENLILLMIVEVVDRGLLASSGCVRPYNNDAEFPSCRASQPRRNAGRDHRVAISADRASTKSKVSAIDCPS
jgi:hypothetical protein